MTTTALACWPPLPSDLVEALRCGADHNRVARAYWCCALAPLADGSWVRPDSGAAHAVVQATILGLDAAIAVTQDGWRERVTEGQAIHSPVLIVGA